MTNTLTDADKQRIAAVVAEKVLGWKARYSVVHPDYMIGFCTDTHACRNWNPFTSADDDYAVLKCVRETWEQADYHTFTIFLDGVWFAASGNRMVGEDKGLETQWAIPGNSDMWPNLATCYEPGDYTLAAHAVVTETES